MSSVVELKAEIDTLRRIEEELRKLRQEKERKLRKIKLEEALKDEG